MVLKTSIICLLLIGYMGFFYYRNIHLPIKTTRLFTCYYISATILNVFELITLYTVNHLEQVPASVNLAAHIISILAVNTTAYLYFLYVRSLLEKHLKLSEVIRGVQVAPFAIVSALIFVLPLDYIQGSYSNYSMGEKVYALYVSLIIYNILVLYYSTRYWNYFNSEKRLAIIASVPVFFIVTMVNILIPESLCSIVYTLLTTVGLMLSNENSEIYIDKQTGMFNQYALEIVSSECISQKKHVVAVVITISESENSQDVIDWRNYITVMEQIQRFCKKEIRRQAYRVGDNGFALLLNSEQSVEKASKLIMDYAASNCSTNVSLSYRAIDLKECLSSDDLMSKMVEICMNAINKMANFDFLTGVRNRNSFEQDLPQFKRSSEDVYYFIIDLNNLKKTNDAMGHSAGDELLQATAKLLKSTAGESGTVYRQGGDEFAVLWTGANEKDFLLLLDKNCSQLNEKRIIPVDFAIGYGKLQDEDGIDKADRMMYENKAKAKGSHCRT